jgi:hypothetical protein
MLQPRSSVHPSQHRVLSTVAAMQVSCGDETESVSAASHEKSRAPLSAFLLLVVTPGHWSAWTPLPGRSKLATAL